MKVKAFLNAFYNPKAVKELKQLIQREQPDLIQIQNLYPFISPAVIRMIKRQNIPLVMRCPNYRLFCPTGLHLDGQAKVCEQCLSGLRELNCIKKNCENNHFKSLGYGLRNYVARTFWGITKDVDAYIVQTKFQKDKFIANGIPERKLFVVPGLTPSIHKILGDVVDRGVVSFIGRVSEEKGIREFIEAAKNLPDVPFKVIGPYGPEFNALKAHSSQNVEWKGFIGGSALDREFSDARIIVVPGKWYEGFPNVITRAMKHAKPVITSNLGAMASIIDHEKNGLLVKPGDADDLTLAIKRMHADKHLCKRLGEAAKLKAENAYNQEQVFQSLLKTYKFVMPHHVI
jgi:glycosyltransferase involved in cell wall biosynthesis